MTVRAREPSYAVPRGEPGLADIVKSTAADVVHLATTELRLVKLEVAEGLRQRTSRLGWLALGAGPIAVGYLLGVAALAAWLTPLWGLPAALGVTALSQAALGAVIVSVALPRSGPRAWNQSGAHEDGRSDGGERRA